MLVLTEKEQRHLEPAERTAWSPRGHKSQERDGSCFRTVAGCNAVC